MSPLHALLLQRTINAPDDFSFGAAEKEATIRELREEVRIVRSRMENNPEVKRYAGAPGVAPCSDVATCQFFTLPWLWTNLVEAGKCCA